MFDVWDVCFLVLCLLICCLVFWFGWLARLLFCYLDLDVGFVILGFVCCFADCLTIWLFSCLVGCVDSVCGLVFSCDCLVRISGLVIWVRRFGFGWF